MFETEEQIAELQALMDRSHAGGTRQMQSILTPERRLSAAQVCAYLQGTKHLALATVTARGEPRVSPVDGIFLWGRFYFGSTADSARMTHLRRRPAVSATHFSGEDYQITVHGHAVLFGKHHPDAEKVDAEWRKLYGGSAYDLAPNVLMARIKPDRMYTFASHPEAFGS